MAETEKKNFIEEIIENDLKENPDLKIITRFPPEPNGYLHIGHAKSICLNFMTAQKYGGKCNLRYDDTNPTKEEMEYINSIERDVKWLGFEWNKKCFASDYFDYMYSRAIILIKKGLAYICDLNSEEIREYRGTLTQPGKNSPYRERSMEENLKLFEEMKNGVYADGKKVLRAKIDMSSPNLNMRDPVIYRILKASHHRTKDKWCIYPMYDFAHPLEDAYEGVTHSICTLEFESHRPLYDWFINNCDCENIPHQYEFARLNLTRTIMSKRYLKKLVDEGFVSGWDDPRMPTLSGLRRRGYTPEAIRDFCDRIGVAKSNSEVSSALLEHCIREDLNLKAPRRMAVLEPLKVVFTNFDNTEMLPAENMPFDSTDIRQIPFSNEIYIEKSDFMEDPPNKYFRLKPLGEVRLKYAYIIKCNEVIKDENGNVVKLLCTIDPLSKSGGETAGRKIKGTLHWVDAMTAVPATVNVYDYLLTDDNPEADFSERLNKDSKKVYNAFVEPSLKGSSIGDTFQFMRQGYFSVDPDTAKDNLVFNQVVGLKDSWAKVEKK